MNSAPSVGLKLIAMFKLISACLLLAVGVGLFRLLDQDLGEFAEHAVQWLHLDPARPVVVDLIGMVGGISPGKLKLIDVATFVYAALYIVEGIGLLRGAYWAEYLVIVATSLLVPFEIIEVMHKPSLVHITILFINLAIVAYLVRCVLRERKLTRAAQ